MMLMDARPDLDAAFSVFGLPATVTPPGGSPSSATAVWAPPGTSIAVGGMPSMSFGVDQQVPDLRPHLYLRGSELDALSVGTQIDVAWHDGGAVRSWRVERVDDTDPEVWNTVVEEL